MTEQNAPKGIVAEVTVTVSGRVLVDTGLAETSSLREIDARARAMVEAAFQRAMPKVHLESIRIGLIAADSKTLEEVERMKRDPLRAWFGSGSEG